jgi:hypothetical protein
MPKRPRIHAPSPAAALVRGLTPHQWGTDAAHSRWSVRGTAEDARHAEDIMCAMVAHVLAYPPREQAAEQAELARAIEAHRRTP